VTVVVVTARDEAERLASTLEALAHALPAARIVLADDGSRDATPSLGRAAGALVTSLDRPLGKGQAASAGCARAFELAGPEATYVLCDADLGASASSIAALLAPVLAGTADLAIAAPRERRPGDGLGIALAFARWSLRRATGSTLAAPISGQRALRGATLQKLLPFAPGFGMELAMTTAALRDGWRIVEVPLALEHRRRGRGVAGFAHRARQLHAFLAVHRAQRRAGHLSP
jgi:glycosyltransferase involved in cell wall biosynthesis